MALSAAVRPSRFCWPGMDHVVKFRDFQIKVTDNRIVNRMALGFFDILGPF